MKLRKLLAGVVAGAVATGSMITMASAQNFDKGVLLFNDVEFTVGAAATIMVGADRGATEAWEAITMPLYGDKDYETDGQNRVIAQKGELWSKVNSVTATFYLENPDGNGFAEDLGYIQPFMQLGEDTGWSWWDAGTENLLQQNEAYSFGPDCKMTYTWNIGELMANKGSTSDQGGLLKMGFQLGNSGFDDINLKIVWTDVSVDWDQTVVDQYVASYKAIIGGGDAAADAPVAGNTAAATDPSKANNPETGVEGVAGVVALAVVASGAIVMSRKRK